MLVSIALYQIGFYLIQKNIKHMRKAIFIDENIHILTGREAEIALRKDNDLQFLSDDNGIQRVSFERWQIAQAAERRHWMERGLSKVDDRNYEHFINFDRYSILRKNLFRSAIEIGCGPFTNLRLIGDICKIRECTLLDPLIEEYLKHPKNSYSKNYLFIESTINSEILNNIYNKIRHYFPPIKKIKRIPIKELLLLPAEQMPLNRQYDLLIIINVIEHCYDVDKIFKNIEAIMKKNSIIVFHDVLFDHDTVKKNVFNIYDAAHPLQADKGVIRHFLDSNFRPLFNRILPRKYCLEGIDFEDEVFYFIGEKLG